MSVRFVPLLLAGLAAGLLFAPPARAAVVLPRSAESLAREATDVVRGTVVSQAQGWDAAVHHSVVRTEIRVSERWKGDAPATVTIQQLGKIVRGHVAGIPGDAGFRAGEDVVLFLVRGTGAEAGAWFLLGLGQGKFSLTATPGGTMAAPEVGRLSFPRAADRAGIAYPRALEALRAEVRRATAPATQVPAPAGVRP